MLPADFSLLKRAESRVLHFLSMRGKKLLRFADKLFRRCIEQYFTDFGSKCQILAQGSSSGAVREGKKPLRNNQAQTGQKRCRYLRAFLNAEHIDYARDGFGHGARMHGGIGRNADFRAFNHAAQSVRITAFTNKHHIRSRSGAVPCRGEETFQMLRNGALGNRAARFWNGVKIKFNGRFVCAYMTTASFNDFPQYGRKQCAFAAAHDTGYKNKAIGGHCMIKYFPLNPKLRQCRRH